MLLVCLRYVTFLDLNIILSGRLFRLSRPSVEVWDLDRIFRDA